MSYSGLAPPWMQRAYFCSSLLIIKKVLLHSGSSCTTIFGATKNALLRMNGAHLMWYIIITPSLSLLKTTHRHPSQKQHQKCLPPHHIFKECCNQNMWHLHKWAFFQGSAKPYKHLKYLQGVWVFKLNWSCTTFDQNIISTILER